MSDVMRDEETYVVICRADRVPTGVAPGDYELATRTVFASAVAAYEYAAGISPSREALVIPGRWAGLRFACGECKNVGAHKLDCVTGRVGEATRKGQP